MTRDTVGENLLPPPRYLEDQYDRSDDLVEVDVDTVPEGLSVPDLAG